MIKKNFILKTLLVAFLFCKNLIPAYSQSLKNLTLEQYLNQVRTKNLTIEKTNQSIASFELLKKKAKLLSAIKLYGFSEFGFAEQNRALQFLRYKSVETQTNRLGFSQDAEFGLNTKFYYSLNNTKYIDLNTNFATNSFAFKNTQAIPVLELSIPLWQNLFGQSIRARRDATFYENEAQKLNAQALSLSEIIDAEKKFWQLVFAQKAVEIQNRALNSAQKILEYLSKREKMNLVDKSDVLQAKTLVESKKLAVKQAQNYLKITARNFNKNRNVDNDIVTEKLEDFEIQKLQNLNIKNQQKTDRLDVKSQQAQVQSAIAQAKIEEENNKPNLNLYTSYSVNQVENNYNQAIANSFQRSAPNGKIGLEFSLPINLGLSSDIRKGAKMRASSEKISYQEKLLQQEVDWQNLQQNLKDHQENLKLAYQIEQLQKAKLENERTLLQKGRTSTYQILVFEQEYSNAELNTQQIAQKLQELIADQKLYQNEI